VYFAAWIGRCWLTSGKRPHANVTSLPLARVVNSASGTKHPRKLPSKSLAIQNRRLFAVEERLVLQSPRLAKINRCQLNQQALFPADRAGFSLHTCPQKSYHSPARDVNFCLLLAGQVLNAATRNLSPNITPQPHPFSHPAEKEAPASPLPKLGEGPGVRASKPPSFEKPCTPQQSPSKKPMGTRRHPIPFIRKLEEGFANSVGCRWFRRGLQKNLVLFRSASAGQYAEPRARAVNGNNHHKAHHYGGQHGQQCAALLQSLRG